jgi:hypothetical protein
MNPIKPAHLGAQGATVADLHAGLLFLIRNQPGISDNDRHTLEQGLAPESRDQLYKDWTTRLVSIFQEQLTDRFQLVVNGDVDQATADALNKVLGELGAPGIGKLDPPQPKPPAYTVSGVVQLADGSPARGVAVTASERDLRSEQLLGRTSTDSSGAYQIGYNAEQFSKSERDSADLVVKALADNGSLLATSPVLFNAPPKATINLTIPAEARVPPTLFEKIAAALPPLLDGVKIEELEQDDNHQDLSFLSGETGFAKRDLARFVLARLLAPLGIQAEFWFALLGGSLFDYAEDQSLKAQLATVTNALPPLDAAAVGKALARGFDQKDIPQALSGRVDEWVAAFLKIAARLTVGPGAAPTFTKQALDQAGIKDAGKQESFAQLFNQYQAMTPDLVAALQKNPAFTPAEIAELQSSYQLSDLTRGDFSVVKTIKDAFGVREPAQIRTLAMKSESEWVDLITREHAAGNIVIPISTSQPTGTSETAQVPAAALYGKTLERQFRETFPTAAFAGGLGRALSNGGASGLQHGEALSGLLQKHDDFDLLTTPVDKFLSEGTAPEITALAQNEGFRSEVKAVQRVFKLAPTFDAANTLLTDGLHSAQGIYRQGEAEFVQQYGSSTGFTAASASVAWNQAANTHAAVLTVVGQLVSLDPGGLPAALQTSSQSVTSFPNWNNLFQSGDLCDCEDCRSVLGPAAYFADLLTFLKDRKAANPAFTTVKDILFKRRPDLGFIELNCENALTPLPYIDVVCEVLEAVIAAGRSDVPLPGFNAMPSVPANAKTAVTTQLSANGLNPGTDFSLSQVNPADPNRWVVHGDEATFLLSKGATTDFSARILCNTKASAAELRAYPAYVNDFAYTELRSARFPFNLPFDLFAEEVRAAFQKCNLQRWDLMRTLRGPVAPNNPTEGEIAAEYFGISAAPAASIDEKRLILLADLTGQQAIWGETSNAVWLTDLANVKTFLNKSRLQYDELLVLLDLGFANAVTTGNPAGEIVLQNPTGSCDTDKMLLAGLSAANLDRIHRFLRLWRKLGWKMWEVDLVIRQTGIGASALNPAGALDEAFLVNLYYFGRLRTRLGGKPTVEQLCALCGDLNRATYFTKLHEKRGDGLYQSLFLNKRIVQPLDHAFDVAVVTGASPQPISSHLPVLLGALRISETDLAVFQGLTKASNGTLYITGDLTLPNISLLWRHNWLSKQLHLKPQEWATVLKLFQQDVVQFATPRAAFEFVEQVDLMKASGFVPDELDWLLAANRSAKAATKETTAARFLTSLRKDLQAITAQYDPAQYAFLNPPSQTDSLTALLTSLLQQLGRDTPAAQFFIDTVSDSITQEQEVTNLAETFSFPATITGAPNNIPIRYAPALVFAGAMTPSQQTRLKDVNDTGLAAVTGLQSYKDAIDALLNTPGKPVIVALPALFSFPPSITTGPNAIPIRYKPVLRLSGTSINAQLQFTGAMTASQKAVLLSHPSLSAVTELVSYQQAINALFTTPGQPATADLPPGFAFPAGITGGTNNIPISVSYIPVQYFSGVITDQQRNALQAVVTGDVQYAQAIDEFYNRPHLALKFFEPVFTAPLQKLPAAVDFKTIADPALALKVSYDSEQQLLRVTGFLSSGEQQALLLLSNDGAYKAAVNSLFAQPGLNTFPAEQIWLTDADLKFPLRDPNDPANANLNANFAKAVGKALTYLNRTSSENLVVTQAAAQLGLTEALTRYLLTQYAVIPGSPNTLLAHLTGPFATTGTPVDYVTQPTTFDGWYWASRAAALWKKWKIVLSDWEKLAALTASAQLLDLASLPLNAAGAIAPMNLFLRTGRLLRIKDSLPESGITLLEVLEKLSTGAYAPAVPASAAVQGLPTAFVFPAAITGAPNNIPIQYDEPNHLLRFAGPMNTAQRITLLTDASLLSVTSNAAYRLAIDELFRLLTADFAADVQLLNDAWTVADVGSLIVRLDAVYPDAYLLAETWERMYRAFYFLESLNAGASRVLSFAAVTMDVAQAHTIKELLRSKFGAESWLALSADIQDVLRERKRDALSAYLLAQHMPIDAPSGKWENTNDLYAYYLLDVEMCSCQLTSRLVQASGSVQLFVQRCLMGLEPDVVVKSGGDTGDSAWKWWTWMRKFQVWVANRKVFLWPENWIAPELKSDRSSFFKDLENELLQKEINQDNVELAFTNYLEKLDGVAQLEIAAFYQEDDGDDAIIHVFGRTRGAEPHVYYYRRYDYRQWTPWEKVDLDIQGDYLVPAAVNKRLFLFWPVFTEISDEKGNSTVSTPSAGQANADLKKPVKKLRLQMAVSDYRQGKWTPKRVSKDFAESVTYNVEIVRNHYRFLLVDQTAIDGRFGIKFDGNSTATTESPVAPGHGRGDLPELPETPAPLAPLSGAFEISGCDGVPALASFPFNFSYAIRPEAASAGEITTFMKWNELAVRPPEPEGPADDFALQIFGSNGIAGYYRSAIRPTPLLVQTPGLYQMSPPWHLSYLDQLLLDGQANTSVTGFPGNTGFLTGFLTAAPSSTPMGSGLPFFYNDKKRTFFVLPCLQSDRATPMIGDVKNVLNPVTRNFYQQIKPIYYPQIKHQVTAADSAFEAQYRHALAGFTPPAAGSPGRLQLEQFLARVFPGEPSSHSDAQLNELLLRYFMRSIHMYLGQTAFQTRQFHFKNFYHPFVCDFVRLVANPMQSIPGLMRRETQLKDSGFSFDQIYQPTRWVVDPSTENFYPKETVDFSPDGAYSSYNWELFFHAPLLIANALSRNQRFEEARNWYHFIFNPIGVESAILGGSAVSKFWITKPFFQTTDPQYVQQRIDNILGMLNGNAELENQVRDSRNYPFDPHRIANYRTVAYQKTVVMNYLDNLIAWGDFLFSQDSMESINEATQLYVMAAEILGARPKKIPPQAKPPLLSFNELESEFDAFSNALVQVENMIPPMSGGGSGGGGNAPPLPMLYFCIPQNDKMLGYWDTVADRLYKIRHCMNIEGVVRQLALFEPPIDPSALVKAVAGGVDIGSALADLNAPLPLYRFNVLLQKTNEICNDVKALGSALLSALEKNDAEALSLLRQGQEIRVLEATKAVREKQIEEARENLEGARRTKLTTEEKRNFYRDVQKVSNWETASMAAHGLGIISETVATVMNATAGVAHLAPSFTLGAAGFGGSPTALTEYGGRNLADSAFNWSAFFGGLGGILHSGANLMSTQASNERRWEEWKLQERLAEKELNQLDTQIAAGELRVAIAETELANHLIQIDNAKATDDFMRSKYTNKELYQWQVGQISGVYFQSYKLAYDLAKRAERCFRFELGLQDSSYISFGYWDSLKKGLLSGEKLQYDLRRLESAYLEQNRRELELTKHISLLLLDPLALVQLRETGKCFLRLPEEIFDLDYPGHYFRRIKSVSLTLPCVTGPYTTIACTLRLLKNSVRINTADGDNGYPRNADEQGGPADDMRFVENNIAIKAIAASSGQNDSGVFELNFRDDRYLPFEGGGAISEWSLELFADSSKPDFGKPLRQFDYGTISDAIIHIKYTAREDAGPFKNGAVEHLRHYFYQNDTTPSLRLFNLRQEFPSQWSRFLNPTIPASANILELEMSPDLFRSLDAGKSLKVNTVWFLARCTGSYNVAVAPLGVTQSLIPLQKFGDLQSAQFDSQSVTIDPAVPAVPWTITLTRTPAQPIAVEDMFLVLGYEWD